MNSFIFVGMTFYGFLIGYFHGHLNMCIRKLDNLWYLKLIFVDTKTQLTNDINKNYCPTTNDDLGHNVRVKMDVLGSLSGHLTFTDFWAGFLSFFKSLHTY